MSRVADLGPLPLNWRDVGLSLMKIRQRRRMRENQYLTAAKIHDGDTTVAENNSGSGKSSAPAAASGAPDDSPRTSVYFPAGSLLRCGNLCPHHTHEFVGSPKTVINLRFHSDASSSYHHSLLTHKQFPSSPRTAIDDNSHPVDDSFHSKKDVIQLLEQQPPRVSLHHLPAENSLEKYDTSNREVARWIASALRLMQYNETEPPILLHCRSGKDRTGVVVCAALLAVGVDPAEIRDEFLLSDDVDARNIDLAIRGLLGGITKKVVSTGMSAGNAGITETTSKHLPWLRGVNVTLLKRKLLGEESSCSSPCHNSKERMEYQTIHTCTYSITAGETVLQLERTYLRKQFNSLQNLARPVIEQRSGASSYPPRDGDILLLQFRTVLGAMVEINCRQICILASMRDRCKGVIVECDNRQRCDENMVDKEEEDPGNNATKEEEEEGKKASKLSRRIALMWARGGYLRKVLGEYKEAAKCFDLALEEARATIILCAGPLNDDEKISTETGVWEKQRDVCESLALAPVEG